MTHYCARCARANSTSPLPNCRPTDRASDLSVPALTSDTLGVCCRAGHPLAAGAPVAMHRLSIFPGSCHHAAQGRSAGSGACSSPRSRRLPQPVVETESMAFLLQMLRVLGRSHLHRLDDAAHAGGGGLEMLDVPGLAACGRRASSRAAMAGCPRLRPPSSISSRRSAPRRRRIDEPPFLLAMPADLES